MICWSCGTNNDAHINANPGSTHERPADGDVSFCIYCGQFGVYDGHEIRQPTQAETAEIDKDFTCVKARRIWDSVFGGRQ